MHYYGISGQPSNVSSHCTLLLSLPLLHHHVPSLALHLPLSSPAPVPLRRGSSGEEETPEATQAPHRWLANYTVITSPLPLLLWPPLHDGPPLPRRRTSVSGPTRPLVNLPIKGVGVLIHARRRTPWHFKQRFWPNSKI